MIALLVVLTVGWVLLSVFGALTERPLAPLYWVLLSLGSHVHRACCWPA